MSEPLIESEFKTFCLGCFGDLSETQYIDLRRTFYGGVSALYFLLMEGVSPGTETTEEDLDMMEGIRRELYQFNDEVKAGRA